jgi:predicted transcriptional regulator
MLPRTPRPVKTIYGCFGGNSWRVTRTPDANSCLKTYHSEKFDAYQISKDLREGICSAQDRSGEASNETGMHDTMVNEALLELAADIITAHVSNNSVEADRLPSLIQAVYGSLAKLGQAPEPVEEQRKPAVSVRSSVKPDTVTCLECGEKLKMLKRHLMTDHGLSPDDYRARWNLPADYPLVAPEYAQRRKELAHKIGLGRKPQVEEAEKVAEKAPAKPKKAPRKKAVVAAEGE